MSHINKIIDADPHFSIDTISRQIRNESSKKVTLIQGDHNSERFSFELPRFVEGHDMLECNRVEVHFINIENGTGNRHEDMYDVKDMQTLPDNPEHVAFSWLITDNATKYVGSLAFGIRFCCTDTDNVADYVWKTAVNKDIKISEGMNTAESVAEEIPDIIAQWEEKFKNEYGQGIATTIKNLMPIKHVQNYDFDKPAKLIELDSGVYVLDGYFDYNGSMCLVIDFALAVVSKNSNTESYITVVAHDSVQKIEISGTESTLDFYQTTTRVNSKIGDIETTLENIITKYGLGGVSE